MILMALAGCQSKKSKLADAISKLEKEIASDSLHQFVSSHAGELVELYSEYAKQFPNDSVAAEYLFRSGDLLQGMGRHGDAIQAYLKCSRIESYSKKEVAFFLVGFIYENSLNDLVNARSYYAELLTRYPNHKLANDVRFSLENLGKTPEELIRLFEQSDSLQAPADSAS